jgi:hypothetical protein
MLKKKSDPLLWWHPHNLEIIKLKTSTLEKIFQHYEKLNKTYIWPQ